MDKKIAFLLVLGFMLSSACYSYAEELKGNFATNVSASIGSLVMNLSGYISPYASVILTSDGVFLRSIVADSAGNFVFNDVVIKSGFDNYCLDAIDFKRLGESYTCFHIPPVTQNLMVSNIFLPPTLGLQRDQVQAGDNLVAWGYGMPGSEVTVHLNDGSSYNVVADKYGYYRFDISLKSSGDYTIYADAQINGMQSVKPDKHLTFHVLSPFQSLVNKARNNANQTMKHLNQFRLGILWLVLPLLIAIGMLMFYYLKYRQRAKRLLEMDWLLAIMEKYMGSKSLSNHRS